MAEITLTNENFETEVIGSGKTVLVDFWASWCGPCKMIAPILEEIANEYEGQVVVGKINVDEQPALAAKFGIMSIPTLLLFRDGKIAQSMIGYHTKSEIAAMLDK